MFIISNHSTKSTSYPAKKRIQWQSSTTKQMSFWLDWFYCTYISFRSVFHANDYNFMQLWLQHIRIRKVRFNKGFHQSSSPFICHGFADSKSTLSFLPAFLHWDKIYSSKRKFRSITILRSFCFSLFQVLLLQIFAHNNSCMCPDIKRLYFLSFNFV